jgi:hypothetical protein
MSHTPSSEEDDYVAPMMQLEATTSRRRTSVFAPKEPRIKFVKPKTTVFGSLPQLSSRSRARLLWEKLRRNVVRLVWFYLKLAGFFRNILNQKVVTPTFANIVEDLWAQLQKYSGICTDTKKR